MKSSFKSIKQGMKEALSYRKGTTHTAVVHHFAAVDVKKTRAKIGMSQSEFAAAFGISTLRHWERGDRTPQGPALVLLNVIAKQPKAVLKALAN